MEGHVKIVAWLNIIYSIFYVCIGVLMMLIMTGVGIMSQEKTAFLITGGIGAMIAAILCIIAVPGIIAGVGLLKLRSWARILAIVVAAVHLLSFPLGTALGVYTIVVMLDNGVIAMFAAASTGATTRVRSTI